jgi:hypothetical protein
MSNASDSSTGVLPSLLAELAKVVVGRYRLRLTACGPASLPRDMGSTLRGAFGLTFKAAVCVVDHGDCPRCELRHECPYGRVFETPVPPGSQRLAKATDVPRPFIIVPPEPQSGHLRRGETLEIGMTLVGSANSVFPHFVLAFERLCAERRLGRQGAEPSHGKFVLDSAWQDCRNGNTRLIYRSETGPTSEIEPPSPVSAWIDTPAQATDVVVEYRTPTRLMIEGKPAPRPEFHILVRNGLRRLSNLAYFHCGAQLVLDFRGIVDAAGRVGIVDEHMSGRKWQRYSTKQGMRIPVSGAVGAVRYRGELGPFLPLLAALEVLHVGKGTVFGLGRIRIEATSVAAPQPSAPVEPVGAEKTEVKMGTSSEAIVIDIKDLYGEVAKLAELDAYVGAALQRAGEGRDVVLTGAGPVWLYLRIAHALHGKAKRLTYRAPVVGDVVVFDHDPF